MASDRELLTDVALQHEAAFEQLCTRYQALLHRHILRIMRNPETADDLLQDTLLRIWMHARQWDGRGSARGWLFRIATNVALNALRTQRRRPQIPLQPPADSDLAGASWEADPAMGPEELAERADEYARLRSLIAGLPEEKREVLRLIHNDELRIDEVAQRLGIPSGTVRSRLHYATRQLASSWLEETEEYVGTTISQGDLK
jgi:RNA polymerase sigma-70 factor, ECF subfamily